MKFRKKSIKAIIKRMIIQPLFFFIILSIWQVNVFIDNINNSVSNLSTLILLFIALLIWFFSYYEIRTVTENKERFLGYKGYVLFFFKLLCLPLYVITALLISMITSNIIILILILNIWAIIYYFILSIFIRKYKVNINNNSKFVYICYELRVEKWYIEGKI